MKNRKSANRRISNKKLTAASLLVAGIVAGVATIATAAAPFGEQPVTLQAQKGKVCTQKAHTYPGGGNQGDTYACAGLRFSPDGKVVYGEFRVEDNMFLNGNGAFVSGADTQVLSAQFIIDGKSYPVTTKIPTPPVGVTVYEAAMTLPNGAKKVQATQNYQAASNGFRPGTTIVVAQGTVTSDKVSVPKG